MIGLILTLILAYIFFWIIFKIGTWDTERKKENPRRRRQI